MRRVFKFFEGIVVLLWAVSFFSCHNEEHERKYLVQFYVNDIYSSSSAEEIPEDDIIVLKTIEEMGGSKSGYLFGGWEVEKRKWENNTWVLLESSIFQPGDKIQVTCDLFIVAKWTLEIYNIKFNANGGELVITSQTSYDSEFYLTKVSDLKLTRAGYNFKGWAESPDAVEAEYLDGQKMNVKGDMILYAVWAENARHTVTFNANGGTINKESQSELEGLTLTLESAESLGLVREGYTFKGWAKESSALSAAYPDKMPINLTEDLTLYAVWSYKVTYKITFDAGEGSIYQKAQSVSGETVNGEVSVILKRSSELRVNRDDYKFKGWSLSESASQVDYADWASIKISGDTTLYAVWDKIVSYTVTFNAGAGYMSSSASTMTVTGTEADGAEVTLPKYYELDLSRSGYEFWGWSENENATYASIDDAATIVFRRDTTLYAVWRLPQCKITYFLDGASYGRLKVPQVTETYDKGETVYLSSAVSLGQKKSGYAFLGWSTRSGSTSVSYKEGDTVKITSDMKLYAVWEEQFIYVKLYHPGYTASSGSKFGTMVVTVGGVGARFILDLQNKAYTSDVVKIDGVSGDQAWAVNYQYKKNGYEATLHTEAGYMYFKNRGRYRFNLVTGEVSQF